jgi:predicted enzyme related to lactoylglutathione lyase
MWMSHYNMPTIVHFEIPSGGLERSKRFDMSYLDGKLRNYLF